MEIIISIVLFVLAGAAGYFLTPRYLNKFIGEILVYKANNGKSYRVLKKPNETEKEAIAKLREKVFKAGTF